MAFMASHEISVLSPLKLKVVGL